MKKIIFTLFVIACMAGASFAGFANVGDGVTGSEEPRNSYQWEGEYSYSPTPEDIYGLDHHNNYVWSVDMTDVQSTGYSVNRAELIFRNIRNWTYEGNPEGFPTENKLFIHIMESTGPEGLTVYADDQPTIDHINDNITIDAFAGQGVLVGVWENDPSGYAVDLVFRIEEGVVLDVINDHIQQNGYLDFGLDPDCYFWNDGATFTVQVPTVPTPSALVLGGIGMGMVGWLRRSRTL